ncbi:hypothetical protein OF122_18620 [Pelagibacterium flavum]|uniref:Uncharacterized protein n=1 Tax=Pelagibacterium flavum TaxID=2984530 RepID=A0ABY6IRV3_9HYPH|nr:hypothetical protein [Pelagibacterium sp. YIM 151497]UYQ72022.1 hypothetical protein OF122_18620 [Pelagibacterium sp. YIM 151497]
MLKKQLDNAVFWFELSIAASLDQATWKHIGKLASEILDEAQDLRIAGEAPPPAYVFITNHGHLADDNSVGADQVAFLLGFKIPSLRYGVEVELEAAMQARDDHREIGRVLDCIREVEKIELPPNRWTDFGVN